MNPNEQQRLANAVNDLRPDWPTSSLRTFIEKNLNARAYRDAAVALVWVAADAKPDGTHASETPRRVLEAGPWWQAATSHDGKPRGNFPPKREQQCKVHAGQWADNCGGCVTDRFADDDEHPSPPPANWSPGNAAAGADACRSGLGTKTSQPMGLSSTEGEHDGEHTGVHPGEVRHTEDGLDQAGLHPGASVPDRTRSDPSRRGSNRDSGGLSDAGRSASLAVQRNPGADAARAAAGFVKRGEGL